MPKVLIDSLESLLEYSGAVRIGKRKWEDAEIKRGAIIVPVVTKGRGWDKRIDSRGARLIEDVQRLVDNIYSSYDQKLPVKPPRVKVEAKEGSNGLDFDLTAIVSNLISHCPPEDISMVIYALIGCGFGLATLYLYWKHKENTHDKKLIEKAFDINRQIVSDALGAAKELSAPIRKYTSSLAEKDVVSVAGSEYLPSQDVKKMLRQPRTKLEIHHVSCDGQYLLTGLVLKNFPPALSLKQGEAEVTALLERLDVSTRNNLVREVEEGMAQKSLPKSIGLQIDAYYTERELKYATVIAIDSPRKGVKHYRIEDVPFKVVSIDQDDEPDSI